MVDEGVLGTYFRDADGVWVNQFVASEVDWAERGVRLVQETRFPLEGTTTLVVRSARPTRFALRVRVPAWARGGSASLNGRPLDGFAAPGGYFVLERTWRDGDRLAVALPMRLATCAMPDDPTLQALTYGPLVLVGRLGIEGLTPPTIRAEPTRPRTVPEYKLDPVSAPALRARAPDPASWIERVVSRGDAATAPLEFRTVGQQRDVTLVPFHTLFDERYAVYWRVTT